MIHVYLRRAEAIYGVPVAYSSLTWLERVNTVTGGTLEVPARSDVVEWLAAAPGTADRVGIYAYDTATGRGVPMYAASDLAGGTSDTVKIPLRLEVGVLDEIPAWPDPATPATPWATNDYWTATGAAVTTTASFLATHGGPSSHTDWRRFDAVTSVGTGATVAYRARMEPSLTTIRDTVDGACIVEADITAAGEILTVRAPVDRASVVFAERLHTALDVTYRNEMPPGNFVVAGGEGEGTARAVATATLGGGMWPRKRGVFVEAASATGADLQDAADKAAVWDGPSVTVSVEDDPSGRVYGRDYLLGDTVRVEVAGVRIAIPVTGVETTTEGRDVRRRVTLGAEDLTGRPDLQLIGALRSRHGIGDHA